MKCCPSIRGVFPTEAAGNRRKDCVIPLETQMLHSQGSLTLLLIPEQLRYLFSQVSLETGFKQAIRKDLVSKTIRTHPVKPWIRVLPSFGSSDQYVRRQ